LSLKNQNAELQEEIRSIRTQLNAFSESLPSTRSWASIAASRSATESGTSLSLITSGENPNREPNYLRISTQPRPDDANPTTDTFTRYLPTDSANAHIRNALLNASAIKDVQVVGVGTIKTGYVIMFKDQQSTETARTNTEWLKELDNDTKLVKLRFGAVVHCTLTEDFSLPENKAHGIKKIIEENGHAAKYFQINDIAWLKSKDKPLGRPASLGIWFDSAEATEWVINNKLLIDQRYIGSIKPYQVKKKRCHRYQSFGHLA
jgi:hypothetical protein